MDSLDNLFSGGVGLVIIGAFIGLIVGCVIQYFFLKNLNDLMRAIQPANRKMPAAQVWLLMIGLVNFLIAVLIAIFADTVFMWLLIILSYLISIFIIIWGFRIVYKVADSIEAEYDSRKIPIEYRPTFQTGMFMAVSNAFTLLRDVPYIGLLGKIASLAYFVGWISYWVRTHKYKKEIQALPKYQDEESLIFNNL